MKISKHITLAALGWACTAAITAQASTPVRWVLPFPAGSASDVIARAIAQSASKDLGVPIIVDNKAGGDGMISATEVARAKPDGNTLLFGTNSALSAMPAMKIKLPYGPVTSFTPITPIGRYTFFLFVNPETKVSSVQELVTKARSEPGKLNFATGNTTSLVSTLQFKSATGVQMEHIAYKGEPSAIIDLMNNQVQVMFANPAQGLPHVKNGKLKVLAATGSTRSELAPDVPTLQEAGIKDFKITSWAGLFAPARTPDAIVEKYRVAFTKALRDPVVVNALKIQGFTPEPGTPADLAQIVTSQMVEYRNTILKAGIVPD